MPIYTPALGGPALGHAFTPTQGLALDDQVLTEIAQSSALSISQGNVPGQVSETALLKSEPAAVLSPLQHAKILRSPDLVQAPCLPKALTPISLSILQCCMFPRPCCHHLGGELRHGEIFPKPCGKPVGGGKLEHPSRTHSHLLSLLKHPSAPFPQGGDYAPCLRGNCFNSSVVTSQHRKATQSGGRWQ